MNRYIAVVKPRNAPVQSFDFLATSDQGAEGRVRISALARWGNPDEFIVIGVREFPIDYPDEAVDGAVAVIVEQYNRERDAQ